MKNKSTVLFNIILVILKLSENKRGRTDEILFSKKHYLLNFFLILSTPFSINLKENQK
jgi:hypothetical protein